MEFVNKLSKCRMSVIGSIFVRIQKSNYPEQSLTRISFNETTSFSDLFNYLIGPDRYPELNGSPYIMKEYRKKTYLPSDILYSEGIQDGAQIICIIPVLGLKNFNDRYII